MIRTAVLIGSALLLAGCGEQEAVYACPMHPEVTSTRPATCPKCGMDLVKR